MKGARLSEQGGALRGRRSLWAGGAGDVPRRLMVWVAWGSGGAGCLLLGACAPAVTAPRLALPEVSVADVGDVAQDDLPESADEAELPARGPTSKLTDFGLVAAGLEAQLLAEDYLLLRITLVNRRAEVLHLTVPPPSQDWSYWTGDTPAGGGGTEFSSDGGVPTPCGDDHVVVLLPGATAIYGLVAAQTPGATRVVFNQRVPVFGPDCAFLETVQLTFDVPVSRRGAD